jgi:hypothetical protein
MANAKPVKKSPMPKIPKGPQYQEPVRPMKANVNANKKLLPSKKGNK